MPDTLTPDPDYPVTMVIQPNLLVGETPAGKRYQRVKGPPWREFELQYADRGAAERAAFDAFWAAHELAPVVFDQKSLARTWTVRFAGAPGGKAGPEYLFSLNDSHSWRVTLVEVEPAAVAPSGSETDLLPSTPDYALALEHGREIVAHAAEDKNEQRTNRRGAARRWRLSWRELEGAALAGLEDFWLRRRDRAFTFAAPDTGANHIVLIDSEFRHVEPGPQRHTVSFDVVEKT